MIAWALLAAPGASAAPHLDGTFEVPGVETNNKIVAGPDGNMWVTVNNGGKDVAKITPAGQVEEFELEGVEGATGIAVDPSGTMWVTTNKGVASFSVSDPKGSSKATDLGLTGAAGIVAGPDGNMWVAATEKVVHFAPAKPEETKTLPVAELSPRDIDVAGSLIVVADFSEKNRIVTFTTANVEGKVDIPGGSQGVAGSPTGQLAFSAPGAKPEQSGVATPPNPAQSFELTGDPFGVAFGADKAFWIVQFTPGVLERVTSNGAHTSAVTGLPKESARQIAAGPGNTLWVTLDKKEGVIEPSVAKISGVESSEGGNKKRPNTTLAKGPKVFRTHHKTAKVKFRFSSSTKGAKFECALTKVRKGKGKKQPKPRFKACKSPRTYHLRQGSYRFWVRAVANGLTDATPAKRSFRVVHVPEHKRGHH